MITLDNYNIGPFDNRDQLRQVWQVCKDAGQVMVRDEFTYDSVKDCDPVWPNDSIAGLFSSSIFSPTSTYAGIGFRCVGGQSSGDFKIVTPEEFLDRHRVISTISTIYRVTPKNKDNTVVSWNTDSPTLVDLYHEESDANFKINLNEIDELIMSLKAVQKKVKDEYQ